MKGIVVPRLDPPVLVFEPVVRLTLVIQFMIGWVEVSRAFAQLYGDTSASVKSR